jgi:hypothetical protein
MPLPSVAKYGAKQCKAISKNLKRRCHNPAAFGCSTCRYHGAWRKESRNTLQGVNHPQYRHGERTKESIEEHQKTLLRLHTLEEIGYHIKMFPEGSPRTRGRKPSGWVPLNLAEPNQMALAILKKMLST